jgi:hypothetical protein
MIVKSIGYRLSKSCGSDVCATSQVGSGRAVSGRSRFQALAGRACRAVAIVAVLGVAGLSWGGMGVAPASAAGNAPIVKWTEENPEGRSRSPYQGGEDDLYVYSTKLVAIAFINTDLLVTKWRAEYSTSKSELENGKGIVASSGELTPKEENGNVDEGETKVAFGPLETAFGEGSNSSRILHHLVPGTHYYGRFVAESSGGVGVLPFEFITEPAGAPEIFAPPRSNKGENTFLVSPSVPTAVSFKARVESDGAATEYTFAYSQSKSGPFTACASGTVSVAEDFVDAGGGCGGLSPETSYFGRLVAKNGFGEVSEVKPFTTPGRRPVVFSPALRNVTAMGAHVSAPLIPNGVETRWRFEVASSLLGLWTEVPGASGTVSQAQAEALPYGRAGVVEGELTGLVEGSQYYVRLFAENANGEEAKNFFGELVSGESRSVGSFRTEGAPSAVTLAAHSFDGEALRVLGEVDPNEAPTSAEQVVSVEGDPSGGTFSLGFDGHSTGSLPYNATVEAVRNALEALPDAPPVQGVEGLPGGPYTVFSGSSVAEPLLEADGSGLQPSGSVGVVISQQGGEEYATKFWVQYLSQGAFEAAGGFGGPGLKQTPVSGVASVREALSEGVDLPGLVAGESYRYRLVASSNAPGNPVVDGVERVLSVPAAGGASSVSCPNEGSRSGASALLPDCRSYELLTPVAKEGAREPFRYGAATGAGVAVGEDGGGGGGGEGERVVLEDEAVNWGGGVGSGQSPYFFSRTDTGVWGMLGAARQPETGVDRPFPELFSRDLSGFAFVTSYTTSTGTGSKDAEFKVGDVGGAYVTAAVVPIAQQGLGWVAASGDFSRLFLQSEDHTLAGDPTHTTQGDDLYEYAEGSLRQVNVTGSSPGVTVGGCGANIVKGDEENGTDSSAHAVSVDGSRVFFEAVPSRNCGEAENLYMRVNGESTVDIGAYTFRGANAEGTDVLLEKQAGEVRELFLYETASATFTKLFSVAPGTIFHVSEDFSTIYFFAKESLTPEAPSGEDLYRYDIGSRTLSFIDEGLVKTGQAGTPPAIRGVSADGQEMYFTAEGVGGVPGDNNQQKSLFTNYGQVYRFDAREMVVQCMSCASPFDPAPGLAAVFGEVGGSGGILESRTGSPRQRFASGDGDYVFFDTPSALLPGDVDGEVEPEETHGDAEMSSPSFSASSDVYEWRKLGLGGCTHPQGCLALITNGRGGYLNTFLGTDESGRDAFIYTDSRLLPEDRDSAGDIYDARINGGEPAPPTRPVECEGDACSTPPSAPADATPASSTFSGTGNLAPAPTAAAPKTSKPKPKHKTTAVKKPKKKRKGRKSSRKSAKSNRRSR